MRKLNRWLEDAQFRPGRTLVINTVAFAIFQAAAWATLAYAIATHDRRLWAIFCANIAIPPIYLWATYNSVQRAWKGQPRNDLDESIPAVAVMGACFVLWLLIKNV
jgi:hypothetical protein